MPENSAVDSANTLRVKNFVQITLSWIRFWDECVFAFYAEIQDGCQNGGKIIFGKSRQ